MERLSARDTRLYPLPIQDEGGVQRGHIYNLKTAGLPTGAYTLDFMAGTDTSVHHTAFQVK